MTTTTTATTTTEKLDERIVAIIAEETDFMGPIIPSLVFYDDIQMDSLQMVEMTMRLEEEFDIELMEDEAALQTRLSVGDLLQLLHEKLGLSLA